MTNRTRTAIRESFLELLAERPLSRITVKDITDNCGINRNSFYYHYADVPTLIEEIFSDEIRGIIQRHPNIGSIDECLITAANFASRNRQVIRHIYASTRRDLFEQYMWRVCDRTVRLYFETVYPGVNIATEDWSGLLHLLSCLCYGIFSAWLADGMRSDMAAYLEKMSAVNRGLTAELVRRCEMKESLREQAR